MSVSSTSTTFFQQKKVSVVDVQEQHQNTVTSSLPLTVDKLVQPPLKDLNEINNTAKLSTSSPSSFLSTNHNLNHSEQHSVPNIPTLTILEDFSGDEGEDEWSEDENYAKSPISPTFIRRISVDTDESIFSTDEMPTASLTDKENLTRTFSDSESEHTDNSMILLNENEQHLVPLDNLEYISDSDDPEHQYDLVLREHIRIINRYNQPISTSNEEDSESSLPSILDRTDSQELSSLSSNSDFEDSSEQACEEFSDPG